MATRRRHPAKRANIWLGIGLGGLLAIWLLWPDSDPRETDDTEALARVIQSEIGNGTPQQQRHVAWTARNLAREQNQTIAEMVCSPCGPQKRGRPLSTRQAPQDSHREIARNVLAKPAGQDPTGGATHFLNPRLQNQLARSGKRPGYKGNSYRNVRRRWRKSYGWRPYYRLGNSLEFWGPKKAKKKSKRRKKR